MGVRHRGLSPDHLLRLQRQTLGILPVSLVKIVLQLLLSHHPFEILRWNCYFLQFHFFVRDVPCVSHDPVLWSQPGQTRWWIAVRESDQWPVTRHRQQSHGGLGLKWSTKSIKSYTAATSTNVLLVSVAMIQQQCRGWTIVAPVSVAGLHSSTNWIHWSNYASYDPGGGRLFVL